jgi:aspartyl-tRNA(Asn)/glutamyl-tRNA(Gln) amidotransferase subunit C
MKIDREEARRIAGLAHLEFDDAGLERMAAEMTRILEYVETLPAEETRSRLSGEAGLPVLHTPLRDDVVRASIDRDAVARNAPEWENGFFVVPPIIEGES